MHFGASTVQIALHTGCYFLPGNSKPVLFAGVSDSLQHVPAAVWAFLRTELVDIMAYETSHFYSDWPRTLYRQKGTFTFFP